MLKRRTEIAHPASGYGSGFFEWIHILFMAVAVAGIINCCIFRIIIIEQHSMEPTLNEGERVYLSRCAYLFSAPESGDIVVFYEKNSKSNFVKRIIGLPGDTITIKDGSVYRNDILLDEPYIKEATSGEFRITVPENTYFCMGDNRNMSMDSRDERIGCIERSEITGKVMFVISPPHSIKQYTHTQ